MCRLGGTRQGPVLQVGKEKGQQHTKYAAVLYKREHRDTDRGQMLDVIF